MRSRRTCNWIHIMSSPEGGERALDNYFKHSNITEVTGCFTSDNTRKSAEYLQLHDKVIIESKLQVYSTVFK